MISAFEEELNILRLHTYQDLVDMPMIVLGQDEDLKYQSANTRAWLDRVDRGSINYELKLNGTWYSAELREDKHGYQSFAVLIDVPESEVFDEDTDD